MTAVTLKEIIGQLGGELSGDGSLIVGRVATLESAGLGDITFLSNPKYRSQLAQTHASAVVLAPDLVEECPVASIATSNPYLYFARVAQLLEPPAEVSPGIHPSAVVESSIPADVAVGPQVWIGPGVTIGSGAVIGAGSSISRGASIGEGTRLASNVSVYASTRIGARCIVHSGAVIGADGFGFAHEADKSWVKIPQTGRVVIGDDVEIGANTTIDRGALEDTVIEKGVKLDNQIQVGHNVRIGAHTAMAGCVGIAGSARIGRYCTIGGGAIILGHLELADHVHVSAGTLVAKSISRPGRYTGTFPSLAHEDWLKNFARLRQLDAMADKIRALESRLAELEKKS